MHRLARNTPFFYGWTILFTAGSAMFVRNAAASLTLAVFVYPISQDLDWSRTLIAGAASLGGLLASFASPLVGWLCDRFGVRPVLALSILVLGLSTVSLAWATVPIIFYLAYATGRVLFSSSIQIGASVVVSRWFIRQRGRATGILFLAHSAGMVVFPLIASFIIQTRGWPMAWIFLGVIVWVVALGPVSFLIIQKPEDVGLAPDGDTSLDVGGTSPAASALKEPTWTWQQAARTPSLWLLAIAGGTLFLAQSGTNVHQGAYIIDQGLGMTVAATAVSLNAIFTGVGSLLWGWLVERMPVRYTYALVALLMAVAAALFVTADSVPEALLSASLFGLSVAGILVVPAVAYANYFGRQSLGVIRGITEPFVSLGQAIGAVLSGLIFDTLGSYHAAFIAFAVVGFITIGILLLAKPPVHRAAGGFRGIGAAIRRLDRR
ncbi:MAG: MFS transporter [Dehalococcoidia bacterium]